MEMRYLHLAARDAFRSAKKVILVAHPKPDGDTLGAAVAMLGWCEENGIPAVGFCVDEVPSQYVGLRGTERFVSDITVFQDAEVDLVSVFDAGDLRFAGIADAISAMPKRPVILNFDHHATNEKFGDVNVLDITSAATAEVVYRFLQTIDAPISPDVATALLTGLHFDTGGFMNPATTTGAFETASALVRCGGKLREVHRRLVRNKPVPALRLWGTALSRLKYDSQLGLASTALFADDVQEGDAEYIEGISNFLGRNLDCKAILVLKEIPDGKVKGSFRTIEEVDVSLPAKYLGGGGHKKAAGFTITGKIKETPDGWAVE